MLKICKLKHRSLLILNRKKMHKVLYDHLKLIIMLPFFYHLLTPNEKLLSFQTATLVLQVGAGGH